VLPRALAVALPAALAGAWTTGFVAAPLTRCLCGGLAFVLVAVPGTWWLGDAATREVLNRVWRRLRRDAGGDG
jgi:hypothetical protein